MLNDTPHCPEKSPWGYFLPGRESCLPGVLFISGAGTALGCSELEGNGDCGWLGTTVTEQQPVKTWAELPGLLRLEEPVSLALTGAGRKSPGEESWTLRLQLTVLTCVCVCVCVCMLSHVQLFVTPGTVVHQAPLSMGLSRQEY